MKYLLTAIVTTLLFLSVSAYAQKFEAAAEDESIVYFVKYSKVASSIVFTYFDTDKCIGKFKGQGYIVYKCNPGEHIFWASREFTNFITADLQAGSTYLVMVKAATGVFVANPVMMPINSDDAKSINKALKVIGKKTPKIFTENEIANWNDDYKESIAKEMIYFEKKLNEGADFEYLSPDMALTSDRLK